MKKPDKKERPESPSSLIFIGKEDTWFSLKRITEGGYCCQWLPALPYGFKKEKDQLGFPCSRISAFQNCARSFRAEAATPGQLPAEVVSFYPSTKGG